MDPRLIELMSILKTPLELNCKAGERIVIVTDFEFDPTVWQAMCAAATQMGLEPTVAMMPTRDAHQAEPTDPVRGAMLEGDVNGDKTVSPADTGLVGLRRGEAVDDSTLNFDLNGDGVIDIGDMLLIKLNYNRRIR